MQSLVSQGEALCSADCRFKLSLPGLLSGEPLSLLGKDPIYQQTDRSVVITPWNKLFFRLEAGGWGDKQVAAGKEDCEWW